MGQFKSKKSRKGFGRPTATAGQAVDREWRNIKVQDLQKDDLLAGKGLVSSVFHSCDDMWYVAAGESNEGFYPRDTEVLAFVRKDN